jgi:hypothetical protein
LENHKKKETKQSRQTWRVGRGSPVVQGRSNLVAEFVVAAFVDEKPLGPGAVLAHVLPHAAARRLDDAPHVGVLAHLMLGRFVVDS